MEEETSIRGAANRMKSKFPVNADLKKGDSMTIYFDEKAKLKEIPKSCGVYCITNGITKKRYYGSTQNLRYRISSWQSIFKRAKYGITSYDVNEIMRNDVLTTPLNMWYVNVLCTTEDRRTAEIIEHHFINDKRNRDGVYNLSYAQLFT